MFFSKGTPLAMGQQNESGTMRTAPDILNGYMPNGIADIDRYIFMRTINKVMS